MKKEIDTDLYEDERVKQSYRPYTFSMRDTKCDKDIRTLVIQMSQIPLRRDKNDHK